MFILSIGNFVSLSNVANTRVTFDNPLFLKGTVVCPFIRKVNPEVSPLMRTEEILPPKVAPSKTTDVVSTCLLSI